MKRFLPYLFLFSINVFSQEFPSFKVMRFDEDYSFLKDSTRSFYESIKYIPLSDQKNIFLSLGGEARAEFLDFNNEDWGRKGIGSNPFLLQRYNLHADLHIGKNVRIFGQLRSAWETGRKDGPRPIDEDRLNVQNLFMDVDIVKNKTNKLTLRAGRQEMNYGSGRLISVREGPNLRLYFDGVKLMYKRGNFSSDAFMMADSKVEPKAFDNTSTKKINFWGSYNTFIFPKTGNLEVYYLGIHRDKAFFEEKVSDEKRHTMGTRFWRNGAGLIYNIEAAYQFGNFTGGSISAWTGSVDVGYRFAGMKGKPSINLKNDYISGDRNKQDGKLQTFNPLYPKGGYFGFNPQVGPVNLIDIHPYANYNITDKIVAQVDIVFNWRYSVNDGVYRPGGTLNLASSNSSKRYIGTAFFGGIDYNINKFLSSTTVIQYFKTGAFINDVIPDHKDGFFVNTRLVFKF
ncbi:alginate export family protein [Chryseobacterium sp. CT-SW4]|uniref:alginate export family protein n=1 Tax=Chryseobacterium sp. SW-1 TaxID=3157343 RepID=UPI003B0105FA